VTKRRPLTGQPVLVASGWALITACGSKSPNLPEPVGNLMAPVQQALCLETNPAHSVVLVNAEALDGRCLPIDDADIGKTVQISVSAEGYESQVLDVVLSPQPVPLPVTLVPIDLELVPPEPEIEPRGNLMPPPRR
jgi:hypothetical protein